MSQINQLQAAIFAAIAKARISHLTREAYESTAHSFLEFAEHSGFSHMRGVSDIKGRHFRAYILHIVKNKKVEKGTAQNQASHIRGIFRAAGHSAIANAPELSNAALGISGRDRSGKKIAMTEAELESFKARALALGRPGMGAIADLNFWVGLRGNEAINAKSDTLERWQREISESGRVHIIAGTKTGKERFTRILFPNRALRAIAEALVIAKAQGGYLVTRRDGKPAGGLDKARGIYHSFCNRAGVAPHSGRYAFADRQCEASMNQGYSKREALIMVSHDLGHGDGRGRWVESVYCKKLPPKSA